MLNPIDFLHDKKKQESYLLNPAKVQEQMLNIFKKDELKEWSGNDHRRFALLNRLTWAMSIIDTVDNYLGYSENDILTFFVAFNTFCDIIEEFDRPNIDEGIFQKSINESVFAYNIVQDKSDNSFISFIRALSFAHTTSVNRGGKFLKKGTCDFVLISIDTESASPTDNEILEHPKVFYFHVLVFKNGVSEPQIFKVFIDEIKNFLKKRYDSCNFEKLKEENEQV